jgi:hypothetical protein
MDAYNEGGGGYEGDDETALDTKEFLWIGENSTAALWAVVALLSGSFNAISTYMVYSISMKVVKQTQGYTDVVAAA